MSTMGFFSASLGISCGDCHTAESGGDWAKYADDSDRKRRTRGMIAMVNLMNKNFFGGKRVLTCYTCHRGSTIAGNDAGPDAVLRNAAVSRAGRARQSLPQDAPEAEQVLDKYIKAIGGAEKLAELTSIAAKGTFQTYGNPKKYPLEMFAKAPAQRTVIVHELAGGDSIDTYDGREAWVMAPASADTAAIEERTGGEVDAAKLTAALTFPGANQATTPSMACRASGGHRRSRHDYGARNDEWQVSRQSVFR